MKKTPLNTKGGSAGKVTTKLVFLYCCYFFSSFLSCDYMRHEHEINWSFLGTFFRDTGLHKLVFKVLLDGTEVAYYVDGQVVILRAAHWLC